MREYSNVDPVVIRRLAEIIGKLNPVELVTPTNVAEEKARWCKIAKNGFYTSPYFSYDRTALKEVAGYSNELKTGKNHISSKFVPESPAEKVILDILLSRIDSAIACTEIAASILLSDDATTNELCHRLYGHPSNTQAVEAYQIVTKELERETIASRFTEEEQKALKAQKFDAIQIGYWFTEIINKYGIEGWTVEVGDQYTSIDVRDKNSSGKPVVGIPTKREVNGLKLLELVGHELECHLRGSVNCKALVEQILGKDSLLAPLYGVIAKSDNELFYEGVAKLSDVSVNGSSALPMPYATIACDQARRGENFASISNIIKGMRMDMGQDEEAAINGAWTTTYRIIRGSTNPSVGGYCFSKDYIYMCGYEVAKQINPEWYDYASMTIEELKALADVTDLSEPRHRNLDAVGWLKAELLSNQAE